MGLLRTVSNLEFMSFVDLLLNKIKPTYGPDKRNNSGRVLVKGSQSRSTPFPPALAPDPAAFNFPFLLSSGSSLCLNTTCLPFSSDLSTGKLLLVICYDVSWYTDTPTSLRPITLRPHFESPSQMLCHHDPLVLLICLGLCLPRTGSTQPDTGYLREPGKMRLE